MRDFFAILGLGVLLGYWVCLVAVKTWRDPRIAKEANLLVKAQNKGHYIVMDTSCRLWLWDEKTRFSIQISSEQLERLSK